MVTPDNPRIVLDVSCVTRINQKSHFSWHAARAIFGEVGGRFTMLRVLYWTVNDT